jgi:hypothetical protein
VCSAAVGNPQHSLTLPLYGTAFHSPKKPRSIRRTVEKTRAVHGQRRSDGANRRRARGRLLVVDAKAKGDHCAVAPRRSSSWPLDRRGVPPTRDACPRCRVRDSHLGGDNPHSRGCHANPVSRRITHTCGQRRMPRDCKPSRTRLDQVWSSGVSVPVSRPPLLRQSIHAAHAAIEKLSTRASGLQPLRDQGQIERFRHSPVPGVGGVEVIA